MSRSLFIASPEAKSGESMVAYGLLDLLTRRVGRVGVFCPVTDALEGVDPVVHLLLSHPAVDQPYDSAIGVSYHALHADFDVALSRIVDRFGGLSARYDAVVVVGSDYTDVMTASEWFSNATIAANLGSAVVLVVHGRGRTPELIASTVDLACSELIDEHAQPVAVVANRVAPDDVATVRTLLARTGLPAGAIPELPLLIAPTVADLQRACGAQLVRGNPEWLRRESMGLLVAAMSLPNVLTRLREDYTVIAPSDRSELLPALILAHQSGTFPQLSAIMLTGGYPLPEPVAQLIDGVQHDLPILITPGGTFETASTLAGVHGRLIADSRVKLETALRVFADSGDDERILRAADSLLRLGVADLTLLGEESVVRAKASAVGVDITGATILSPKDPDLVDRFAAEYTRLRADEGMTEERAAEMISDVSYFGTMMVHLGMADGMVSGAAHTTAHTIVPSFEIIKTAPGTATVSSVFLMCLADRVLVYGDCAVNPDPTAEQLADIAISSAGTAVLFGIEPRVAMLSYSTGTSGAGADVEKVRVATGIVHDKRPDLLVDGPIQYDAAVDPGVAATKLPHSQVAGRATVLIFPDLNTGNNTYKAVQRSANAVAIGPILQGLNKPVNDLSRGALVADIVNTVAITAIQAQGPRGSCDVVVGA